MSTDPNPIGTNDCLLETPPRGRLGKRVHGSVTNLRSHKRRRSSMVSLDFGRESLMDTTNANEKRSGTTSDRFISNRPKAFLPLNLTPRTNRIGKKFGLVDDRVLSFRDDTDIMTSSSSKNINDENTFTLLRRSASTLFYTTKPSCPSSVTENLNKRKQCLLTLDSPGISKDPDAFPIAWSQRNLIAVACMRDIFYQNLDTKVVSRLGTSDYTRGKIGVIEWAGPDHENYLASGNTAGNVELWDAGYEGIVVRSLRSWTEHEEEPGPIRSFSWNKSVLAVGTDSGEITIVDTRAQAGGTTMARHRSRVVGLKWSDTGNFLASGDKDGIVHVWDWRNSKSLCESDAHISKLRLGGNARALSWCPWKSHLLATGSGSLEGKIQTWDVSSLSAHSPVPQHTIPLNASVLSLQWSPHCRELLSTHGASFLPPLASRSNAHPTTYPSNTPRSRPIIPTQTPLTNSIVVHEYPSCKRLLTLSNAHAFAVTHNCLSPDGQSVFTVCPGEEAIKMWRVWSKRPPLDNGDSAFTKFMIR